MLVLSRRIGETIVVPNCDLTITVVQVRGKKVRLGLCAPEEVVIQRKEIVQRPAASETAAAPTSPRNGRPLASLPR
jgi:carbon storage regulator